MSKIIEVEGCIGCPYSIHTDDSDWYCGIYCALSKGYISWTEDEFYNLPSDYIDENCILEDK